MCSLQQFDQAKNFGYHQFRVEAQPEHWRIEIDDQVLGEIPENNDPSATSQRTIQLSVGGSGAAHFEQIRFRAFKTQWADDLWQHHEILIVASITLFLIHLKCTMILQLGFNLSKYVFVELRRSQIFVT